MNLLYPVLSQATALLSLISLISLCGCGCAVAAPPPNDHFANRTDLGVAFPVETTGSNVQATLEATEPDLGTVGSPSIWWSWTAAASGPVDVETVGGFRPAEINADDPDPIVIYHAVYTGTSLSNLNEVPASRLASRAWYGTIRFQAVAGTSYAIQAVGLGADHQGPVTLRLRAAPPPPANDGFADATALTVGVVATGSYDGATLQSGEVFPPAQDAESYFASAWWSWLAPEAGWYRLVVTGGDYETRASLWTGASVAELTSLGSVSGALAFGSYQSRIYFQAVAGTRYAISIADTSNDIGADVSLRLTAVAAPPVYNVSFAFSEASVDVGAAAATVTATFRLTSVDPISFGELWMRRGDGDYGVFFTSAQRISGSATDGTYAVPIEIPRYLKPGSLEVYELLLPSAGDEDISIGEDHPTSFALGAVRSLAVENTGLVDLAPPVLESVQVSPSVVDVSTSDQVINVVLDIADTLAGFSEGYVRVARRMEGGTSVVAEQFFSSRHRTAGTAQSGTYSLSFPMRMREQPGAYFLEVSALRDHLRNEIGASYSSDRPGFPGPFTGTIQVNRAADGPFRPSDVEAENLSWSVGGSLPWTSQTAVTHDGSDAARSGGIGHDAESWLETAVTGPGALSFWWKVSSEADYDFLEFYLDGVLQSGRISGEVDWSRCSYSLAAGPHELRWRYYKDWSDSGGADLGWVDQVDWVPADGYRSWSAGVFSAAQLADAAVSGDKADPDGDGVPNLVEFLFGGNPLLAERADLPALELVSAAGGQGQSVVYRYQRKLAAAGVVQVVEHTADLSGAWTPAVDGQGGATIAISPVDATTEQVAVTILSTSTRRFVRLKATR